VDPRDTQSLTRRVLSARVTVHQLLESARARISRLEPEAAFNAMQAGAVLIDTRCAEQREADGHVPGSVHFPLSVLYWRLDPESASRDDRFADPSRHIVLLCAHGYSSSIAAATLQDLGFANATDVIGGFEAWLARGLPIERETA
jgi:rhodanese-related sulfurtransferase